MYDEDGFARPFAAFADRNRGHGSEGRRWEQGNPSGHIRGMMRRGEAWAEDSAPFPLRKYSSTDSVNRGRGGRGHRDFRDGVRGGNVLGKGSRFQRDNFFDIAIAQRDTEQEQRRGGGGGRGRGEDRRGSTGEGGWRGRGLEGGNRWREEGREGGRREDSRGRGGRVSGRGGGGVREDGRRGGRGGGRGGGNHSQGVRPKFSSRDGSGRLQNFPMRFVADMEDTDEAILRVNSQMEVFEAFLCRDFLDTTDTTNTLKVLTRVLHNDLQREIVMKILLVVCTSHFLDTHLLCLIQTLSSDSECGSADTVMTVVDSICQVLNQVCLKMPSYASKGLLLLTTLMSMTDIIQQLEQHKPQLVEGLKELLQKCKECLTRIKDSEADRNNQTRAKQGRRGPNPDDDIPPDDFAQLPIFPSAADMDWNEKIFLRANKEEGSYRDVNHYLDVQFRLLREDYIRPLRLGIRQFRRCKNTGEVFRKNHDLRMYHKVQILSMVCKDSLEHRLQFDMTHQLRKVRWQSSKRLLFGSLVCLTCDDFDTIFFAVVTERDCNDLAKGIIQVRFESGLEEVLELSSKDLLTMAETTAYFEAYRHVLEGLKEMKDNLPMDRYLVQVNPTIKTPKYLLAEGRMGKLDLSTLLKKNSSFDASAVTVVNPQRWPPVEETTLNESQLTAVQTALTKELAIIQGPPGTGKTYMGLKLAHALLVNRSVWTDPAIGPRPILVVCYTNHALDQFLEGILDFCPEGIIRVGSRCKNPDLEPFNLKNLRQKFRYDKPVSKSMRFSLRDCKNNLDSVREAIKSVSCKLEASNQVIVNASVLAAHMLPGQYQSLVGMEGQRSQPQSAIMLEWLSKGTVTHTEDSQGHDSDPYPTLTREVISRILQGSNTCPDSAIGSNPQVLHQLAPTVRAQLYRWWLLKVTAELQQEAASIPYQGSSTQIAQNWLDIAKGAILPDLVLKRVITPDLYNALTQPLKDHYLQQVNFCVRAWLGVLEDESPELMQRLCRVKPCDERQVHPQQIATIPLSMRFQLYRFWLDRTIQILLDYKKWDPTSVCIIMSMAERGILPDDILQYGMDPSYFQLIKQEMMARHQKQMRYLIQSWLGVQNFCQNTAQLVKLLDSLDEESESREEEEERGAYVEEEAEIIQRSRQLDDDDDLFNFSRKSRQDISVQLAMEELGVQPTAFDPVEDEEGFSLPKYERRKELKKLRAVMTACRPLSEDQATQIVNLRSQLLSVKDRVSLYLFWLHRYQDSLRQSVRQHADEYNRCAQELREVRMGEDKDILQEATIIGMTTTGAARYRRVLTAVACPIIILEEAAEVLEAHVVTTLHKTCQHLILIGDHQQLKPSPTVYELSLHYKLDLSLFERLINNRLPHSTLSVQHRMRPEVACLVRHVYPELQDHVTTMDRPHIRGLKQDVFLFNHEMEESTSDELSSKSNQFEAELCVGLCRFLIKQDHPPSTITILTAYAGQVLTLKNIIKTQLDVLKGVRLTTVDNFQGEENNIIILSLVRSNQQGSVGFLGSDNRVCVALSRARNGFFAFGNFRILAQSSNLWKQICRTAKDNGQLGDTLVLRCQNHPGIETRVNTAKDFDKMPEGGCRLPCATRLQCGHVCELICHGYDREHMNYRCPKKCDRTPCSLGHPCPKKCWEDCGKCEHPVTKTVPMCGHQAEMNCHRDPHTWVCKAPCQGTLPCGHPCSGDCDTCRRKYVHVSQCKVKVEKLWPCGHLVETPCYLAPGELPCDRPCGATLSCSHLCQGTCGKCWGGRVHVACKQKCGQPLPGCGHRCPLPCGSICQPCSKECWMGCIHSTCTLKCGVPCQPCQEPCPWTVCQHQPCQSKCHTPCPPCSLPCPRTDLKCGTHQDPHPCSGLCGEKCFCFRCNREKFSPMAIEGVQTQEQSVQVEEGKDELVMLPFCGHIFKVVVLDVYVRTKIKQLPPRDFIQCPVTTCGKRILPKDCWRYHGLFSDRHHSLQKQKEDLLKAATIPNHRRRKLIESLAMLSYNAVHMKSFISGTEGDKDTIDVNTALTLTNHIKMARVFEMTVTALKVFESKYPLSSKREYTQDMDVLQKLLYKPAKIASPQQLEELSAATRRFAIMTKLLCAVQQSTSYVSMQHPSASDPAFSEQMEQMESSLKALKENAGTAGLQEAEGVVERFKSWDRDGCWTSLNNAINISILDEPLHKNLCDCGKPSGESDFADCEDDRAPSAVIPTLVVEASSRSSYRERHPPLPSSKPQQVPTTTGKPPQTDEADQQVGRDWKSVEPLKAKQLLLTSSKPAADSEDKAQQTHAAGSKTGHKAGSKIKAKAAEGESSSSSLDPDAMQSSEKQVLDSIRHWANIGKKNIDKKNIGKKNIGKKMRGRGRQYRKGSNK